MSVEAAIRESGSLHDARETGVRKAMSKELGASGLENTLARPRGFCF
jgi:hypothetical protein